MQRYINFLASTAAGSSPALRVLDEAVCTVYLAGTTTLATLYSDNGITLRTNPFLSASNGQVAFYAANGLYDLVVTKTGYETVYISGIELDDLLAPSGSGSVGYLPAGAGAVSRTVQSKLRDTVSVTDFGAIGNGVADDTAAIQAAIVAANANGGGVVLFPSGTYKTTSTLTLLSNVELSGYGATISWSGVASTVVTTATTGVTTNAGIEGLTINGSTTATTILALWSTYHCNFRDLVLTSTSTTNFCIDMRVNTSGGTNADGNRNNVFNQFDNIIQEGTCGTSLRMKGNSTVPTVVTLNTFVNFNSRGGAAVRGIDFADWCDSNYFAGITRLNLPATATGAIGVEWNTTSPTTNTGVYANNFDHLAVDTFGAGTGRVGIKMNLTKFNKLGFYFNEPVAEGGDIVISSSCYGYDILHAIGGTNLTAYKAQGTSIAVGGAYSNSYSIYTSSFTLTGTSPASARFAETFPSSATGTAYGVLASNATQATAFTMGAYWAFAAANINKGAGSTVTSQGGLFVADLTNGTNNYAVYSQVSAGTNKYGLYMIGGARNYLGAGGMEVAAGATNMTAGFTHVPAAAGAPSGAPTNPSGNVPLYYDSTNNRLYAYNGAWRSVVLA